MMGYLRHKFAIEIFISIQGFPPDTDWFPNDNMIENWKVIYASDKDFINLMYLNCWKRKATWWKEIRDKPFHIPNIEKT